MVLRRTTNELLQRFVLGIRPEIFRTVANTLKNRFDRMATAPPGHSHHTMNREASYLAQFVGKGFDTAALDSWLVDAVLRSDMPKYDARLAIIDITFRGHSGTGGGYQR